MLFCYPVGIRRPPPHSHLRSRWLLDTQKGGVLTDLLSAASEATYGNVVAALLSAKPEHLFRGFLMVNTVLFGL